LFGENWGKFNVEGFKAVVAARERFSESESFTTED
jgi:hypothetical protein